MATYKPNPTPPIRWEGQKPTQGTNRGGQGSPPFNPNGGPGPRPQNPQLPPVYPPPGGPVPSTVLPPPPGSPQMDSPSDPNREAFLQAWRERVRNRIPLNTGRPGTLPPPQINKGPQPIDPRFGRSGGKPYQEGPPINWRQGFPGQFPGGYGVEMQQFNPNPQLDMDPGYPGEAEQEDQMPRWMRARLRRNPGGGGQLGRGRGAGGQDGMLDGGESELTGVALDRYQALQGGGMQSMPVGSPQPMPMPQPGFAPQGRGFSRGARGAVNAGIDMSNPYANGFEFFNY